MGLSRDVEWARLSWPV